jgi:hypothetical protein
MLDSNFNHRLGSESECTNGVDNVVINVADQIHSRALEVSRRYQCAEAELIEVLQLVDQHKIFIGKGYSSLFAYVVQSLGLSESIAYNLITVSRKAKEIPELKEAIQSGVVTLSNARRITSVLTVSNKNEWLEKAAVLSYRQLEKEIVKVRPMEVTQEKVTYVTESRVQVTLGLSEVDILKLRRVQDLLSQARRKSLSLEDVLSELAGDYLRRFDPVEKAKRHIVKKTELNKTALNKTVKPVALQVPIFTATPIPAAVPLTRVTIPSKVLHQVNFRDGRRCTHANQDGVRCNQGRFIEIHHIIPVTNGGQNTLENLTTLCTAHHQFIHRIIHQSKQP